MLGPLLWGMVSLDSTTDGPSAVLGGRSPKNAIPCIDRWPALAICCDPLPIFSQASCLLASSFCPLPKKLISARGVYRRGSHPHHFCGESFLGGGWGFPQDPNDSLTIEQRGGRQRNFPLFMMTPLPNLCPRLHKVVRSDFLEAVTLFGFNLQQCFWFLPSHPLWLFIWIGGGVEITWPLSEPRDASLGSQNVTICAGRGYFSNAFVDLLLLVRLYDERIYRYLYRDVSLQVCWWNLIIV